MSINREEFNGIDFQDKRLNNRYIKIMDKIKDHPELSFPKQMNSWTDLKGLYRFFDNNNVTYKGILFPHIDNTVKRCFEEEVVLIIQDTTYLSYSHHPKVKGMGYIGGGNENFIGMLVHSGYAVSGRNKMPLGLIHQEVMVREKKVKSDETRKERLSRKKESEKWEKGLTASYKLLLGHKRVIQVCDREADIYFFIKKIMELGQGFVIRCGNKHRSTKDGHIFEEIKKASIVGYTEIELERNGNRKKRIAALEIKFCKVDIKAPEIINRDGEDLPINVIIAEEKNFQDGKEKLFWVLLTNENIETKEDCLRIVRYYQSRWLVEDFHKGLKSGCRIEERQLQSREKLIKLLGMFSIMTYQLLLLRFQAKSSDNAAGEIILNSIQITILKNKFPEESRNLTPNKMLFLIARLGGFIGRKSDKSPGWLTLMRGLYDLLLMEQGFILATEKLMGKG